MREFIRRIAAARRAAAESESGDAALEYALVASGVAMAVGYGLFISGVGTAIDDKLRFAESILRGGEPAVIATAPQAKPDDIVTGSIGRRTITAPTAKPDTGFAGVATDDLGRLVVMRRDGSVSGVIDSNLAGTIGLGIEGATD
ncbi:MAG: hypothetical protein R3D02_06520 [Hyphomicrobiales bacterium]